MTHKRFGIPFWIFVTVLFALFTALTWHLAYNDAVDHLKGAERVANGSSENDKISALDLIQQTDAARWAFGQMLISFGALCVSSFGLFFLWQSLEQTRKALADNEFFGEADTSAYVHAATMRFNDNAEAILTLNNTGPTPVKAFAISINVALAPDGDLRSRFQFSDAQLKRFSLIPPQHNRDVKLVANFTQEIIDLMESIGGPHHSQASLLNGIYDRKLNLLISGNIYYQNFYNKVYRTQYAFYYGHDDVSYAKQPSRDLIVHELVLSGILDTN